MQEKVTRSIAYLAELYLDKEDLRPWAIAWSGGKDSTTVLSLVLKMLESLPTDKRTRHIHVVMSDTRVENPEVGAYMHSQVEAFNHYVKPRNLPIEAQIVHRPVEHSYFVLTLGRGYFLPLRSGAGRWCTQRLKISPQDNMLKSIDPSYIIIGTRLSESASREASIRKWSISDRVGKHVSLKNTHTFMPIVDWTIDDVWAYLSQGSLGWTTTNEVRRIYKEATGECGVSNPRGVENIAAKAEACGARFGCWLCPVVANDRSTEEMTKYHAWLEPLTYYRELQAKVYGDFKPIKTKGQSRAHRSQELRKWEAINEQIRLITKCGYNRAGKRMKDGQGTFTVEARRYLFDELMATQKLVNRLRKYEGLADITLIDNEEISLIKKLWADDEVNTPHVVTNAIGRSIDGLSPLVDGKISEKKFAEYIELRKSKEAS
ncbi:phosphoadenosine phosphosulfate reductase family protein [Lysinibacillus capsici]|uniref:phosphoadenosine phosphosulfate reductase domain-containing protein n=1 Tax=Lysinibacillus capsici TaxID=2115968 RepID=UPI000E205AB1|nr:phosphoadenosine phosphosulfate reductase family protein [Lysinibacillus capsici]RDV26294.1 hypothetical protein C7B89_21935 [Lysinibacillus capsici]